jgi:hypothetical protein
MRFCPPRRHQRHHHRVVGRFAGIYYVNHEGVHVVSQTVPASTNLTVPLIFTQDGNPVKGPIGEVLSSDPNMAPPTLSADGQAANFTSLASGTFTLRWHIADASVAPFTVDVDVAAAPPVPSPIIGGFGTIVPGTTP